MAAIGRWDGHPVDPTLITRMAKQLEWLCPDEQAFARSEQAGLMQNGALLPSGTATESHFRCQQTGCLIAADARIDNRHELAAALKDVPPERLDNDSALILTTYLRWGDKAPTRLVGDFSFVIWDPRNRSFFCARDRLGVRPFYYWSSAGHFACASHPAALLAVPNVSKGINEQRLACYLMQILPDDSETFYSAIQRLPPGYSLHASSNGLVSSQYWSPLQVKESIRLDRQEYADTFRALFLEAVRCRIDSPSPIGSTLSGGLDSSSIACAAALLRREQGDKLHTFSAIFPSLPEPALQKIDERPFIQLVQEYCGSVSHELHADQLNPFSTLSWDVQSAGQPYFGPNMYMHNGLYQLAAQNGVKVFLDGIDGDSVVSYGFERLPSLLLKGSWKELTQEIEGLRTTSGSRQSLVRLAWRYAVRPVIAELGRLVPFYKEGQRQKMQVLHPAFRKRIDAPALIDRHLRRIRIPVVDAAAHHRASLAMPYLSHILEQCAFFSARCGVDARYPFLDCRLVEFCLSLPPEQKLTQGWSRAVHRRAMVDIVPDTVLHRISKADLSPNYYHGLALHGSQLLENSIRPMMPSLASYLDVDRLLPRLTNCLHHPSRDPEGSIIFFMLACLTLWLSQSGNSYREELLPTR